MTSLHFWENASICKKICVNINNTLRLCQQESQKESINLNTRSSDRVAGLLVTLKLYILRVFT